MCDTPPAKHRRLDLDVPSVAKGPGPAGGKPPVSGAPDCGATAADAGENVELLGCRIH